MSTISKNNTNDGTLKRVHTEVSDFTSSDEESMSSNFKKTKTLSSKTWPRFLVNDENLLKSKLLCNISINVTPRTTLNSSKGVVRSKDLEGVSEEEICENLSSQGITSVKRIKVRRNNTLILTFSTPTLPDSVKAGYLRIPVVPYI